MAAAELAFGVRVLRADPHRPIHRVFFLLCADLAVWSLASAFIPTAADRQTVEWWAAVSSPAWILAPTLILHFLLLLLSEGRPLRPRWLLVPLYLPAAVFLWRHLVDGMGVAEFSRGDLGWLRVVRADAWFHVWVLHFITALFVGMGLLAWKAWRDEQGTFRHRVRWVLIPAPVVVILILVLSILLPQRSLRLPELGPLLAFVWLLGIWRSVEYYSLFSLTPRLAADEIVETMAEGLLLVDHAGVVQDANPAMLDILRLDRDELVGRPLDRVLAQEAMLALAIRTRSRRGPVRNFEVSFERPPDGSEAYLSLSASRIQSRHLAPGGTVVIARDVTERRLAEQELLHSATHDQLTGLPNRTLLMDRLDRAIALAERHGQFLAVMVIDLDEFKEVNDTLGHRYGDLLLQETARRLRRSVRNNDTVARLGGDEFVVLLVELDGPDETDIVTERILAAFRRPVDLGAKARTVNLSMGASIYPQDAERADELVQHADLAMYAAKEEGTNLLRFFGPELETRHQERALVERELRSVLERDELFLLYQPVIDLDSGSAVGVEALLRWRHPELGVLAPDRFLEAAEETGAIVGIGRWVLRSACDTLGRLRGEGWPTMSVSVNLSAPELFDDGLVASVRETLEASGLEPAALQLEVREETLVHDFQRAREQLDRLHAVGVGITLDDYGTGFASLLRLKMLPVQSVKIPRSFLRDIHDDPRDAAVVMAMMAMARSLGLEVVMEGVESDEQLEFLRSFEWEFEPVARCDRAQGFLFGRPMTPEELVDALRSR